MSKPYDANEFNKKTIADAQKLGWVVLLFIVLFGTMFGLMLGKILWG